MNQLKILFPIVAVVLSANAVFPQGADVPAKATPEGRAIAYLAREVPRWYSENKCYSCHNNGDAARALYRATKRSYPVPAPSLTDTTSWLIRPGQWEHNRGDPAVSDKGLARLQFAAALAEARDAGEVKDRQPLLDAARLVAADQKGDGSWRVDAEGNVGSATTYGSCLATGMARRTLHQADPERHRDALARADRWLCTQPIKTVLDAAAVHLALVGVDGRDADDQRGRCLVVIRKGQSKDGGWGPFVNSPPEAFDTALVVLALAHQKKPDDVPAMRNRGRAFLISLQRDDGSWLETTRPSGSESYAQRLSTAGWATLALLATDEGRLVKPGR